jgi:predicted transcriptional regulator
MVLNKNSFFELEILKHVEQSAHLNNRMVAGKLNCSVKLAHSLLKKMVQKGFFNIKKLNARRWDYYLTPRGVSEKARLTYEFLEFSMKSYKEARKKSSQVCKNIAETKNRDVVFIGSGDLAEICYLGVKEWGLNLIEVYDDTNKKRFMDIEIKPFSALINTCNPSNTDLVCSTIINQGLTAKHLIICAYNKSRPMSKSYLPQAINEQLTTSSNQTAVKLHWIF